MAGDGPPKSFSFNGWTGAKEVTVTDIMVYNQADLATKLAAARGGETFVLAPGNYGLLTIKSRNFATPITITSADANNPAKIEQINITGSRGIAFTGLDMGSPLSASETASACHNTAQITNSSYISFDRVHVYGSLDGNPTNDRDGLNFRGSNNIAVTNSTFEQLSRGLLIGSSQDVTLSGNMFKNMSTDGMDFAAVQRVAITGNTFTNFTPKAGDHPDAIQFWTSGTTVASSDISITNNKIMMGGPEGTQGIFLRDETGALPYQRVTIDNNLVYINSGYNGITVAGGNTIAVTNNTVVSQTTDTLKLRINLSAVTNGTVANNVSDQFLSNCNTNLSVSNNIFFADQPSKTSLVPNLCSGLLATASDLIISGIGYQEPAPTIVQAAIATVTAPTTPKVAVPKVGAPRIVAKPKLTAPAPLAFAPATLGETLDTGKITTVAAATAPLAANDSGAQTLSRNTGLNYEFGITASPKLHGFG